MKEDSATGTGKLVEPGADLCGANVPWERIVEGYRAPQNASAGGIR